MPAGSDIYNQTQINCIGVEDAAGSISYTYMRKIVVYPSSFQLNDIASMALINPSQVGSPGIYAAYSMALMTTMKALEKTSAESGSLQQTTLSPISDEESIRMRKF